MTEFVDSSDGILHYCRKYISFVENSQMPRDKFPQVPILKFGYNYAILK